VNVSYERNQASSLNRRARAEQTRSLNVKSRFDVLDLCLLDREKERKRRERERERERRFLGNILTERACAPVHAVHFSHYTSDGINLECLFVSVLAASGKASCVSGANMPDKINDFAIAQYVSVSMYFEAFYQTCASTVLSHQVFHLTQLFEI